MDNKGCFTAFCLLLKKSLSQDKSEWVPANRLVSTKSRQRAKHCADMAECPGDSKKHLKKNWGAG